MKRGLLFILLHTVFQISLSAQNLVPNYSFEEVDNCDFGVGDLASDWTSATSSGTPDTYHTCATTPALQVPNVLSCEMLAAQTGEGYAGIIVYGDFGREYLQAELIQPLVEGQEYYLSFYVSPTISCGDSRFTDAIGLAFSNRALNVDLPLNGDNPLTVIEPVLENVEGIIDEVGAWKKISRCYTANGDETHVVIGSFTPDDNTNLEAADPSTVSQNYFFIDDVIVAPFDPLPDTTLLCGDEVTLFGSFLDTELTWSTSAVGNEITVDSQGVYSAFVSFDGCLFRDETYVFDLRNIEAFSFEDTICMADVKTLAPSIPGAYQWSTGSKSTQINVSEAGNYTVTVTNECDTYIFDYTIETKDCSCNIFIPNTFTPNNDQINDELEIFIFCESGFQFKRFSVYDRKGSLVFISTEKDRYWDGTFKGQVVQSGVYVWMMEYDVIGQEGLLSKKDIGDVTLLK